MRRHSNTGALKTFRVNGESYEIHVGQSGMFWGRACGESFEADTLAVVEKKIRALAKKAKREIAIPAMLIDHELRETTGNFSQKVTRTCLPITIIGVDWQSGELKYRGPDGFVLKRRRFAGEARFGKPMTEEQVETWKQLKKTKLAADEAFASFERKFLWDTVEKVVEQAIKDLADDPQEGPEQPVDDPR